MEQKTYHIEPNTVQETLVIPLYGKKRCAEQFPQFYQDPASVALVDRVDYDWSRQKENWFTRFGMLEAGMRVKDTVSEIEDYLQRHPRALVVNLGCGLDDMMARVDNGRAQFFNLDLPDVIAIRNDLLPPRERETNLAVDLNDHSWMQQLPYDPRHGAIFFACGVFYYFKTAQMCLLLLAMEQAFPGGRLVFDTGNQKALKLMLRTYIKGSGMDLDAFFYVDDPKSITKWLPRTQVSSRGYMTGYTPLDKSFPWLFRFMGRFGDKAYALRILRLDFNKGNR